MITAADYPGGVWLVDFEFRPVNGREGNLPEVVCLVAREYFTGHTHQLWAPQLQGLACAPFATDSSALFVAYYASAEISCFLALGWPVPVNVLDLFAVFRNATNGLPHGGSHSLLHALAVHGCPDPGLDKEAMRQLVLRGGPWTRDEQQAILSYCASDVFALQHLLPKLSTSLDLPRDLLRGRYMSAAAAIEQTGVPIDGQIFSALQRRWPHIQQQLIRTLDQAYGVFIGTTFNVQRFGQYLRRHQIPWPQTATGRLKLDDEIFKERSLAYPQLQPLRELRKTLAVLHEHQLQVGDDGRNRVLLSVFRSKTGRNQPSNSRFIFGLPAWMRGLIQPPPGYALAYIDWSQQEFGIAAALSGDPAMMAAYASGDPYLEFAKQAGAVPATATKASHPNERSQYKQCAIAMLYGMAGASLAAQIQQSPAHAHALINAHKRTYQCFWQWSDSVSHQAQLGGQIWTAFGWRLHYGPNANDRSIRNFPMQANGAEMLRLTCIRLHDDGIRVCAPIHDALLVEAPVAEIEATVAHVQAVMAAASRTVLGGFSLYSEATVIHPGERYMDDRGKGMWNLIMPLAGLPHQVLP